jgi:hypothetical protein
MSHIVETYHDVLEDVFHNAWKDEDRNLQVSKIQHFSYDMPSICCFERFSNKGEYMKFMVKFNIYGLIYKHE